MEPRRTEHDTREHGDGDQPRTAVGRSHHLAQLVELGGQRGQLGKIGIEGDDFVERDGRLVQALSLNRRPRALDAAIDAAPPRA